MEARSFEMNKDTKDAGSNLAEDRTDLSEDRTIMANERTFAAWLRTGLAAVGIGLGFNALFGNLYPAWAPKAIATLFIFLGIFVFYSAQRQAIKVLRRLESHEATPVSRKYIRIVSVSMGVGSVCLAGAIWFLNWTE